MISIVIKPPKPLVFIDLSSHQSNKLRCHHWYGMDSSYSLFLLPLLREYGEIDALLVPSRSSSAFPSKSNELYRLEKLLLVAPVHLHIRNEPTALTGSCLLCWD